MAKPTPVLIKRNQSAIDTLKSSAAAALPLIQAVCISYLSLNLGGGAAGALDTAGLRAVLSTTSKEDLDHVLRMRMVEGQTLETAGGLPITAEALASMLRMPDLTELHEAVQAARLLVWSQYGLHGRAGIETFAVIKGKAEVDPEALERVERESSIYATTENEIALVQAVQQIADSFNELVAKYPTLLPFAHAHAPGLLKYAVDPSTYSPHDYPKGAPDHRLVTINPEAIKGRVG